MDRRGPGLKRAETRRATRTAWLLCPLLVAIWGCRLPCYEGPSTKNVLESRQLTQRGMREVERGQWVDAERLFAKAVKECPADAEAHRLYAEALWRAGQQEEALFQMSEAVRLDDGEKEALVRYAEMRLSRGEFETAFGAAQQVLDANPQSAEAWALRGRLRQSLADYSAATADFHQALRYEPNRRDALQGLAEIYRQRNEPRRALANLQALADTYPAGQTPREVLIQQGQALDALGRPADAAEQYAAACQSGGPDLRLYMAAADCQMRGGNEYAARGTLEKALTYWPGSAELTALSARLQPPGPVRLTSRQ